MSLSNPGSSSMTLISDTLLSGAAANIDVQNIPGGYRVLWAVAQLAASKSAASDVLNLTFNNDTGANYDRQVIYSGLSGTGNASANGSFSVTAACDMEIPAATAPANSAGAYEFVIPNYSQTTFHKTGFVRAFAREVASGSGMYEEFYGFNWRSTSAITRITLTTAGGNLVTGSRFMLYGI